MGISRVSTALIVIVFDGACRHQLEWLTAVAMISRSHYIAVYTCLIARRRRRCPRDARLLAAATLHWRRSQCVHDRARVLIRLATPSAVIHRDLYRFHHHGCIAATLASSPTQLMWVTVGVFFIPKALYRFWCLYPFSVAEWLACWSQAQKGPGSVAATLSGNSHTLCLCSPNSKIGSSPLKGCGGNCGPGGK